MRSLSLRIGACVLFVILLSLCSGCATGKLWDGKQGFRTVDVVQGTAEQVYLSFDSIPDPHLNTDRAFPKYIIPYRLKRDGKDDLAVFSDKGEGILIIAETGSYYSQIDIESQMSQRIERLFMYPIDVDFLCLTVLKDGSRWWVDLPFQVVEVGFVLPADDFFIRTSLITRPERIPPLSDSPQYKVIDSDLNSIVKGESLYNVNFCCNQSTYYIVTEHDVSGAIPLLPLDKVPVNINVYVMNREKVYNNALFLRLAGTPFALAADIVTFPIQLVLFATMDKWIPK